MSNVVTRLARSADRWIGWVSRAMAATCGAAIALLMVMTCVDVARRFLTGRSIPGVIEYSEVLLAGVVFLGMGMAQRLGAHVRMEALVARLRPRARAWVEAIAAFFCAALVVALTSSTAEAAAASIAAGEFRHGLAEVPIWPAKLVIPIGLAVFALELIRSGVRSVAAATAPQVPELAEDHPTLSTTDGGAPTERRWMA